MKNTTLFSEEYTALQYVWDREGIVTLKDFLVWHNNFDVDPFMEAAEKMATFYRDLGVDVFKQCISIPGLTLRYVFQDLSDFFLTGGDARCGHVHVFERQHRRWAFDHFHPPPRSQCPQETVSKDCGV